MDKQTIQKIANSDLTKQPDFLRHIRSPEPDEPYYYFLYLLAKNIQAKCVVELGTYIGTSVKYMAAAIPEGHVYTFDNNPDSRIRMWDEPIYSNAHPITSDSVQAAKLWAINYHSEPIDLLFIDANHDYSLTISNFRSWLPFVRSNSVILFDDVQLDDQMKKVMAELEQEFDVIYLNKLHHTGFAAIIKP